MAKGEFLQKAHTLILDKHVFGGYLWSEKLDGMRCFWDGGISLGTDKDKVPWANTAKDERFQDRQIATGLWTTYSNVIHAPNWWTAQLPRIPFDGELYIPGDRQLLMSTVKKHVPIDSEWKQVSYNCFDEPAPEIIFGTRVISNPHFKKVINWQDCKIYVDAFKYDFRPRPDFKFWKTKLMLERHLDDHPFACAHPQLELPMRTLHATRFIEEKLEEITSRGGEGIIIRHPDAPYICEKTHWLHKMKRYEDAEGTVVGYTSGREGKDGLLLGLMGNVILELENGKRMELSGFTFQERELVEQGGQEIEDHGFSATGWATRNPGKECPHWITSILFPRGSRITFRYRGLSNDDIPNEAHYFRVRNDE